MGEGLSADQIGAFKAAISETWNLPVHIEKYFRYDDAFRQFFQPTGDLVIEALGAQPGWSVLDVAAGTGLLTLEVAELVGGAGRVHATDVCAAFVELIERKAGDAGLAQVSAALQDAHDLDDEQRYDAALCRFATMYFADPELALGAIRRALRPGGRFVSVVWTDPGQPLFAATFGALGRRLTLPAPVPGAPSPFRYAPAGAASADLVRAGFVDVAESTHTIVGHWPLGGAELWDFFVGALVGPLERLDAAARAELDEEIIGMLEQHRTGDVLDIPMTVHLVTGQAPS
ncbi:MAG: methyltransferase domain-containing protein [Acidimicrobiales bacterium]